MQDKDVEKELEASADKITVKSFQERWEGIKNRLSVEADYQEVLSEDTVLVGSGGTVTHNVSNVKKISLIVLLLFLVSCALILAIVLPIMLKKDEMGFFIEGDLVPVAVSEEQFYNGVDNTGMDLIDFSEFEISSYITLITDSSEVKGGIVEVESDDVEYYLKVTFYDKTVLLEQDQNFVGYDTYFIGSIEIKYNTEFDEEIYSTNAFVKYRDVYYIIDYISFEDNCKSFLGELFA